MAWEGNSQHALPPRATGLGSPNGPDGGRVGGVEGTVQLLDSQRTQDVRWLHDALCQLKSLSRTVRPYAPSPIDRIHRFDSKHSWSQSLGGIAREHSLCRGKFPAKYEIAWMLVVTSVETDSAAWRVALRVLLISFPPLRPGV